MINFVPEHKLSFCSTFDTRSSDVLELMESIFGPVFINLVNIEPSIINENWPRFNIYSDVIFTVNYPLIQCILCNVNVEPTGVSNCFVTILI